MNVGIVTAWFERGAAYVSRQYRNVLERKHNVLIYARGGESFARDDCRWDDDKVTWGMESAGSIPMPINLKHFRRWIISNGLDLVFFNEQHTFEPVLLCNQLGIRTGAYVDYYTRRTLQYFGIYDFLVCNTLRHHSVFGWHPQIIYVPWGTLLDTYSPKRMSLAVDDQVTFFHSGGMNPYRKGTDLVVKAFAKVDGPSRLVLHTQMSIISQFPAMRELVSNLRYRKRLLVYEKTVPPPGLYHLGDVYAYPSRLDGLGLTIPEALACGLPVITADNAPMNEFVSSEIGKLVPVSRYNKRSDGYYWPEATVKSDDLRDAMQFYVENMDLIPELKRKARAHAMKHLDWFENAKCLPGYFETVRRRTDKEKRHAEEKAREAESKNLALRLYRFSPGAYKAAVRGWQIAKNTIRRKP